MLDFDVIHRVVIVQTICTVHQVYFVRSKTVKSSFTIYFEIISIEFACTTIVSEQINIVSLTSVGTIRVYGYICDG